MGMIVKMDHKPDRATTDKVCDILKNSYHRGSVGTDPLAGDGGGICFYGTRPWM